MGHQEDTALMKKGNEGILRIPDNTIPDPRGARMRQIEIGYPTPRFSMIVNGGKPAVIRANEVEAAACGSG
jgi:hypothetical protein